MQKNKMDKLSWFPAIVPTREGQIKKVDVGGKSICIIREAGKFYATSSRCPHAGADISQGWCEGGKIVCPYHRHKFDLESGRGDPGQGDFISTYSLREENGKWFVGIPKPWWKTIF